MNTASRKIGFRTIAHNAVHKNSVPSTVLNMSPVHHCSHRPMDSSKEPCRPFAKAKECGNNLHLAMLCMSMTPIDNGMPSTSELLNGRKYKLNLPTTSTRQRFSEEETRRTENVPRPYNKRSTKSIPARNCESIYPTQEKRGIWPRSPARRTPEGHTIL